MECGPPNGDSLEKDLEFAPSLFRSFTSPTALWEGEPWHFMFSGFKARRQDDDFRHLA